MPTAWGAVAVAYRMTCPLARDDAIGARLVSSAVLCAVGTGIVLHIRRRMLSEVRHARRIAEAAQSVLLRPRRRASRVWPSPPFTSPPTWAPASAATCTR